MSSAPVRPQHHDSFGQVVATFDPLRENATGRLEVRVVELRGEPWLDIRQFVTSETFTGFTKRGLCLSAEEFQVLLEQVDQIRARLTGVTTTPPQRRPRG